MTDKEEDYEEFDEEVIPTFSKWLNEKMLEKKVGIPELAYQTGLTYTGIWNITQGNTKSPREETRKKLAKALKSKIPEQIEAEIKTETVALGGLEWADFTPADIETIPEAPGVYVFYDITGRPVYVGKSGYNVRIRVRDHQTRFWFKEPIVSSGAFLRVDDKKICAQIEMVLIKFLGKHALLNTKGVVRDLED